MRGLRSVRLVMIYKIVFNIKGRVVDYGTYNELLQKGTDFASVMHTANGEKDDVAEDTCLFSESNGYLQRRSSNTGNCSAIHSS